MTIFAAKVTWFVGVAVWFVMRQIFARGSRRVTTVERRVDWWEHALLLVCLLGLFVVPLIYVLAEQPRFANYTFRPVQAWLGAAVFVLSLWLFYRSHKDLGANWSVTLEIRAQHCLVTNGVYTRIRHPMYAAFWLWALAQALLLPNWVAGAAGFLGFGLLFYGRVEQEELMMLERFGEDYRSYMARTARIIPGVY